MNRYRLLLAIDLLAICGFLAYVVFLERLLGVTVEVAQPASTDMEQALLDFRLVDFTERAGVQFEHVEGAPPSHIADVTGSGVALGDYNGDGLMDIYIVQGSGRPNELYRNLGSWRFERVGRRVGVGDVGWGMGAQFVDFDGDADLDLFVTNLGPDQLYENLGDGTFRAVEGAPFSTEDRWSTASCWGDVDGDGDLDLFVTGYVAFDRSVGPLVEDPQSVRSDRDEPIEFTPHAYPMVADRLYLNLGAQGFLDATDAASLGAPSGRGLGACMADLDGDRDLDIYVVNDVSPNNCWINDGHGRFLDVAPSRGLDDPRSGMGVVRADMNLDGLGDLISTHWHDEADLYLIGTGNGFVDVASTYGLADASIGRVGWGVVAPDFNGDGAPDLAVACGYTSPRGTNRGRCAPQRGQVFVNDGRGVLKDVTTTVAPDFARPRSGRGLVEGDLDGDGDQDLVLTENNGPASVFSLSSSAPRLVVRLKGRRPNTQAIGAVVRLFDRGKVYWRQVHLGASYLSSYSGPLVFHRPGEGARIEVAWPNGAVEQVQLLPQAGVLDLTEK